MKGENMKTLIDPVCGMTVNESALRVEGYDDVAFCAPGCRTAFLADPDGYMAAIASVSAPIVDEGPRHGGHHVDHGEKGTLRLIRHSVRSAEGGHLMTSRTLSVPDISCQHCKSSIEGAVGPLNGVDSVEVAIDERTVAIDYDGTDATFEVIVAAIEEQGYEVAG
jgi:copper chaperone